VVAEGPDDVACRHIFAFRRKAEGGGEFVRTDYQPDYDRKMMASEVYEAYQEVIGRDAY